jgi:hypothetical protein
MGVDFDVEALELIWQMVKFEGEEADLTWGRHLEVVGPICE